MKLLWLAVEHVVVVEADPGRPLIADELPEYLLGHPQDVFRCGELKRKLAGEIADPLVCTRAKTALIQDSSTAPGATEDCLRRMSGPTGAISGEIR